MIVALKDVQPLLEERQAQFRKARQKVSNREPGILFPASLRHALRGTTSAEWQTAIVILEKTLAIQKFTPQLISLREFSNETNLSIPSVRAGLRALSERGLVYEARETLDYENCSSRYALLDTFFEVPGPFALEDGSQMVILLVGQLYLVPIERVKQRRAAIPSAQAQMPPRERISLHLLHQKLATLPTLQGRVPQDWPALRERIFARDNYTCFYCGRENFYPLHCDHVIPPARGGEARHPSNLVTACGSCTSSKGALLPEEWLR
jgi:5-methylcytosine-specific restriction endonuclease McrA